MQSFVCIVVGEVYMAARHTNSLSPPWAIIVTNTGNLLHCDCDCRVAYHRPNLSNTSQWVYLSGALSILNRYVGEEMMALSEWGEGITRDDLIDLVKQALSHPDFDISNDLKVYW